MKYKTLSFFAKYADDKITPNELLSSQYISTENMLPDKGGITYATALPKVQQIKSFKKNDILISNIRPNFKKIWKASFDGGCSNDVLIIRTLPEYDSTFLYYALSSDNFFSFATKTAKEGAKMPRGDKQVILNYKIPFFTRNEQEKIGSILSNIDTKIHTNKRINDNLEKQVMALYGEQFIATDNSERYTCRVDEFFDISIGKTPPRKEPQWFSTNPSDVTWVSISDMASCGLYIRASSEQLTSDAVKKHNVKIVPDNTVLLSFKLTVGRIAITDGEMTTNEAIAHFKTDNKSINEYLYCYLKNFNFQTMGSTSSIATAVNSKIIKAMPFIVPTNDELCTFHEISAPMFALIKANHRKNVRLTSLRDSLLQKLMSGELDVSELDI